MWGGPSPLRMVCVTSGPGGLRLYTKTSWVSYGEQASKPWSSMVPVSVPAFRLLPWLHSVMDSDWNICTKQTLSSPACFQVMVFIAENKNKQSKMQSPAKVHLEQSRKKNRWLGKWGTCKRWPLCTKRYPGSSQKPHFEFLFHLVWVLN